VQRPRGYTGGLETDYETFSPENAGLCYGLDADELSHPAAITKFYVPRDACKQSVVFAQSDVLTWFVSSTALADEDRTAGDKFAAKRFDTEPLRI
jgi:hypothetical protein